MSKPAPQAEPARTTEPRKTFVAPRLQRLGALRDLTRAFDGPGTDTFIVGRSKN